MSEINLISAEQKRLSLTHNTVWIASIAGGLTLLISLTAALAAYSLNLVNKKRIEQQENLITNFQQKIAGLSKVEQRQFFIYNRLDSSAKLFASRSELKNRINRLVEIFPPDIVLENVKIDSKDKSSEIDVRSDTFAGFSNMFKIFKQSGFSEIEFDGINRDKDGIYRVKIIITL